MTIDEECQSLLDEVRQFTNRFGPANCWTGSLGQACAYLRKLLDIIEEQEARPVRPISPE